MANAEHVDLLKHSVGAWNQWRHENNDIQPDLFFADLRGCNLAGANLQGAYMDTADLSGTDLNKASLIYAIAMHANFSQTNLCNTHLSGANLCCADLSYTNLSHANLFEANLTGVLLDHANLFSCDLFETNLSQTSLTQTSFEAAQMGHTILTHTDLGVARGLERVIHRTRSYIDIETVFQSKGNIPLSFLQGIGLPDTFIHFTTHVSFKRPTSCYISFAREDEEIATDYYTKLQAHGIRCWLEPECSIPEAAFFDEVHVILISTNSIKSDWIEQEIRNTLNVEKEEKRLLCIPILLDKAIFDIKNEWLKTAILSSNNLIEAYDNDFIAKSEKRLISILNES